MICEYGISGMVSNDHFSYLSTEPISSSLSEVEWALSLHPRCTPMTEWSKNNRACTTLWATLFRMNQVFTPFSESGELSVGDLTFYNEASSNELREQEATIMADQLDIIFIVGRGAEYEEHVDRTTAVASLVSILTNETKTVTDLAGVVDDHYLFWGERNVL